MKTLTSKDSGLSFYLDELGKNALGEDGNKILKQLLLISHEDSANNSKMKGQLALEQIFGFCRTLEKRTKNLGFHQTLKTAILQDFFFTIIDTDINVTINSLYLFVPKLIPSTDIQVMFNECIQISYTNCYDGWHTERKKANDGNGFQIGISSARHFNSPIYLIAGYQTADKIAVLNKSKNIAVFDNVNVRKYFVEIDGAIYLKNASLTNFAENDYRDQYREFEIVLQNTLVNDY